MLVRSLTLTIQTGSDDLRAGTGPNDNADAILTLQSGHTLDITNINGSQRWNNNETHSVPLAIPAGTKSGDIVSLTIHTQFGAGGGLISADNWNINQVTLQAVLQ
jgi:hypothetical protein